MVKLHAIPKISLPFFLLIIAGSACNRLARQATPVPDILVTDLDTTVNPGVDFFSYANGGWLRKNPIPPSESGWGIGNLVEEDIDAKLKRVNENALRDTYSPGDSITQKIGNFWYSGMDSVDIEKEGLEPLQPEMDRINSIHTRKELLQDIAHLQTIGVRNSFSPEITQDDKNSSVMVLRLDQGGLSLPNRDYYTDTASRIEQIRQAYRLHLYRIFTLGGDDSTQASRETGCVMSLETMLAKSSRKLQDLRDPMSNYHKLSLEALDRITPDIRWEQILRGEGISGIDTVIVGQPEFYSALGRLIHLVPVACWKAYLRYHLLTTFAGTLDSALNAENFHFYGTVLSGIPQQRPRWKRVLDLEQSAMGELLGRLFVREYFPPREKQRYTHIVEDMVTAFRARIRNLPWMSDSTKSYALFKLSRMNKKIGYPDKWKDFSALYIDRGPLVLNMMRAYAWWHHYETAKLGKPVDRTEWGMTPQTYNAYYDPSNNEIVLPAAIFSIPGVPDSLADDAMVYGYAAASTIGHEMTHGFDDEGRQFDAGGNLRNWWTKSDSALFVHKANVLVRQFDHYVVLDSLHINGKACLGENIADLGGIVIGLDAFKKTTQYREGKPIDGQTPLQRYFLGYALGWLYQQRTQNLVRQILSDVHAPANFRVNGPLSDVPEFYAAFHVLPGQPMWRPDSLRVKIW